MENDMTRKKNNSKPEQNLIIADKQKYNMGLQRKRMMRKNSSI